MINNQMTNVQPIILCGGSGTRLWPLSRSGFPKQFLCLTNENSLFQLAAKRLINLNAENLQVSDPIIVTGENHRFLATEQLRELGVLTKYALLEPIARNTAPALTLAALAAESSGEDPILVVTPADHIIADDTAFRDALHTAIEKSVAGGIVILGIQPSRAEPGYGYIQAKGEADQHVKQVVRFVEKPDAETASQLLKAGEYFWNAGIFVVKSSVWLKAVKHFRTDIFDGTKRAWEQRSTETIPPSPFIRPGFDEFLTIPSVSIDYAVIEQCPDSCFPIHMVPLAAGWSDLGAWDTVWDMLPKDESSNAQVGDVITKNSHNTLVHASSRLVVTMGVENQIIVETPDVVLVMNKANSQDINQIISELNETRREEQYSHRKVHRPWGWYDCIDAGERFKVKRIEVKPGASLSLQKHEHRAEHWVVVKGTAEVTNGKKTLILSENESTFIPLGAVHRLKNPGETALEIIEVQSGSHLVEEDIVRLEDNYGRPIQTF